MVSLLTFKSVLVMKKQLEDLQYRLAVQAILYARDETNLGLLIFCRTVILSNKYLLTWN